MGSQDNARQRTSINGHQNKEYLGQVLNDKIVDSHFRNVSLDTDQKMIGEYVGTNLYTSTHMQGKQG